MCEASFAWAARSPLGWMAVYAEGNREAHRMRDLMDCPELRTVGQSILPVIVGVCIWACLRG